MTVSDFLLFGSPASSHLTKAIGRFLKVAPLTSEVIYFSDGEVLLKPSCSVRGKTVYLIQATSPPVNNRLNHN